MATKKELEIQIEALQEFLTKQRARWDELNPQEQAHYESVDEHLQKLRQEKSRIDDFERQPEFRNQRLLRGIGNLALNFLPNLRIFKGLRGPRENQQGLPSPFFEGDYEILGETDLRPTEGILSLPMGPPTPEGHIPINLPTVETPPPVDFNEPVSTFFGASTQNVQNYAPVIGPGALRDNVENYLRWQEKMINELPENATTEQFIDNQAQFLDMHTRGLQERLNLNPSQVRRIKTSFEDYVGTHWGVFDPSQNTTSTIANRLSEHIEGVADALVKQAANTEIGGLSDVRFEAVATDPDYALDTGTQQPLVPDAVFTPEIDPVFLSNSPLRQFLAGRKKGNLDPATVLDELGIELTDKGVGFKNMDNRGFNTQAVDSGVANLLRNRMRDNATVTKEELLRVLDHHRGQFSTELTFGEDTSHQNAGYQDYLRLAESPGGFQPTLIDDFEIVSKYRPVLEEGGRLGNSPFSLRTGSRHNWASDDIGDQHFWLRGEVVEYPDELVGGVVGEIQSDMGWADSPRNEEYAWLSDIITPESEEITDIQNREALFETAYDRAMEEDVGGDVSSVTERDLFPLLSAVRQLSSGRLPITYDEDVSWIEHLGRVLSDLNPAFGEEFNALHNKARESAINSGSFRFDNVLLDEQPFAEEFGIELTKEDLDIPLSELGIRPEMVTRNGVGDQMEFSNRYVKALRSRLIKNHPELEYLQDDNAFTSGMAKTQKLMSDQYRYAMDENASDFYKLFTEEALGPLFKERPALEELYAAGQNAPTEAELKKLTEYQDQQSATTALADFPMKKTYPRYSARSLIQHALEQGWDTVEIANNSPGQGGSLTNYTTAVKELNKIANEFNLPLLTRSATMPAATGEEGGGTANREVTFYRLDIRPLRALIEAKKFKGFKGMKHGGLVTKAQGAGYNVNYGDYGRDYV